MTGYEALRESAAWLDLDARGRIRMTGEDRVRLLHAMCTNNIEALQTGESCYAFFLNAQGRILCDANVVKLDDSILLDTEPETHDVLYGHLDKYIIADDVTLTDERGSWSAVGVEGPQAPAVLEKLDAGAVRSHWTFTGAAGGRLFVPREGKAALVAQLGVPAVSAGEAEVVRLENGRPRYGSDVTEKNLLHETQLLHAVHFSKGCYLGQEIVERVRSRGQVHRLLVPLTIESASAPDPGSTVMAGDAQAGETTSSAFSPALGKCVAFAYLRAEYARPGTALQVGGANAEVSAASGK